MNDHLTLKSMVLYFVFILTDFSVAFEIFDYLLMSGMKFFFLFFNVAMYFPLCPICPLR